MSFYVLWNALLGSLWCGMVACGFAVLYRAVRFLDFGYAAAALLAPYAVQWLTVSAGWPFSVAAAGGVLVCCVLAAGLHAFFYRSPTHSAPLLQLLMSLGVYIVLQNAILLVFGTHNRAIPKFLGDTGLLIGAFRVSPARLIMGTVAVVVTGCVLLAMYATPVGLLLRAAGANRQLAVAWGLPVDLAVVASVALAYALAACAGILSALDTNVHSALGFQIVLVAVVGATAGGADHAAGAAVGGLSVGLITHVAVWYVGGAWEDAILLVILLLFLLVRPFGVRGDAPTRVGIEA